MRGREDLKRYDYARVKNPSLLRFLVDMKGADIDLTTMLIAGHESTTATAVLIGALFELTRNP